MAIARRRNICSLEMSLDNMSKNLLHASIVRLEIMDRFLDCGNEVLLSISGHFGVHSIALASVTNRSKKAELVFAFDFLDTGDVTMEDSP